MTARIIFTLATTLTILFVRPSVSHSGPPDANPEAQFAKCSQLPAESIAIAYDPTVVRACEAALKAGYRRADTYFYLGRHLFLAGHEQEAITQLRLGQELGSVKATTALGYAYGYTGRYRPDSTEVLRYYRQAVRRDDPRAMLLEAEVLLLRPAENSRQEDANIDRYLQLIRRAAGEGDPFGYFYLAEYYMARSEGNAANRDKAVHYYRLAADAGVLAAQEELQHLGVDVSSYKHVKMKYDWTHPKAIAFARE